jgi:hypothetical protein
MAQNSSLPTHPGVCNTLETSWRIHEPVDYGVDAAASAAIFEILVAAMWSNGELTAAEVERGRAAAVEMALSPRGRGAFGAIADGPLPFPNLGFEHLDQVGVRLAYAAARWIVTSDGPPSERHLGFIRALRTRLRLTTQEAARLDDLAATVAQQHPDPRASFAALCKVLERDRERLAG